MTAPLRPVALVVGPWKDATPEDHARMDEVLRTLVDRGWAPVFYPRAFLQPGGNEDWGGASAVLDDHNPDDRLAALCCSTALVQALAESRYPVALVVVPTATNAVSAGMRNDIDQWRRALGSRIRRTPRAREVWWRSLDSLDRMRDRLLAEHAQREAVRNRAREALEEVLR